MIDREDVFKGTLDKMEFSSTTSLKFKEDLFDYFGEKFLNKKVLELGTHYGYSTRFLSFFFEKVYTIDNQADCITKARQYCRDRNNIEFWEGDLYNSLVYFDVEPREQGVRVPGIFDDMPKDIDVVFIDAMHLYPTVIMDSINTLLKFDKPIIIYDDYGSENPVKRAVYDLIKLNLMTIEKYIGHEKGDKIKNRGDISDYLLDHEGVICRGL